MNRSKSLESTFGMENTQMNRIKETKFSDLVGKTLSEVKVERDKITFIVDETESYSMFHGQDCCEQVWIEDICGDLNSLVGVPILFADESSSQVEDKSNYSSLEWTFYRIGCIKGSAVIRWCADLDTYYSVQVDFVRNR